MNAWPPPSSPPFPGVSCLLLRKISKPNELIWYPTRTDLAHLSEDRTVARVDFPEPCLLDGHAISEDALAAVVEAQASTIARVRRLDAEMSAVRAVIAQDARR